MPSIADVEVVVHDLSATGLLIEAVVDLQIGDRLGVEIPGAGPAEAVVVWASGSFFGCEFARRIPKAALSAAALRSAPQAQLQPVNQPRPTPPQAQAEVMAQVAGNSLALPASELDEFSPRQKLLILLGLSVASWAGILLIGWLVMALAWR